MDQAAFSHCLRLLEEADALMEGDRECGIASARLSHVIHDLKLLNVARFGRRARGVAADQAIAAK